MLTKKCGTLISPCYPNEYPEEVANGAKLWDINANKDNFAPVVGKCISKIHKFNFRNLQAYNQKRRVQLFGQ